MLLAGLDFTSNPNNSKKNTIITSQVIDNKVVIKKLLLFYDFKSLIEFFSKISSSPGYSLFKSSLLKHLNSGSWPFLKCSASFRSFSYCFLGQHLNWYQFILETLIKIS